MVAPSNRGMNNTADHLQLDLNGISLSLYRAGPEQGKLVWLLHGFPECCYSWRHQVDQRLLECLGRHFPG